MCVCVCVCVCVHVYILSPWRLHLFLGWNSRGQINDLVLKTLLSSTKFLHRYFSMKHQAFLTSLSTTPLLSWEESQSNLDAWVLGHLSAWVLWDSYFTYEVSFFEITGLLELFTASVRPVNTDLQYGIIREMVPLERAALLDRIRKGMEKQLKKRL